MADVLGVFAECNRSFLMATKIRGQLFMLSGWGGST